MNLLALYDFIRFLEEKIGGKVTLGVHEFAGLQIRGMWFYKDKNIHWQYTISLRELEFLKGEYSFFSYVIEKAKAEYQKQVLEIDANDRT